MKTILFFSPKKWGGDKDNLMDKAIFRGIQEIIEEKQY
ncbi:hypothetical protein CWATWH0402_4110 [Crocosphaera watsonii WH 0402]|uniref:Uncharacterized protein n=2 Tax=Crocosphaera watsonii TaxID=263511 RepID=T2JMA6_CROWT|nr:hypothetical protein CWATWH0005_827 [Crocosphaera watsonii WH 0005]CCQ66983.1 hypothetical protein CWATWH0402_4110 [Crocosphaera watsonii WH 0402]